MGLRSTFSSRDTLKQIHIGRSGEYWKHEGKLSVTPVRTLLLRNEVEFNGCQYFIMLWLQHLGWLGGLGGGAQ